MHDLYIIRKVTNNYPVLFISTCLIINIMLSRKLKDVLSGFLINTKLRIDTAICYTSFTRVQC